MLLKLWGDQYFGTRTVRNVWSEWNNFRIRLFLSDNSTNLHWLNNLCSGVKFYISTKCFSVSLWWLEADVVTFRTSDPICVKGHLLAERSEMLDLSVAHANRFALFSEKWALKKFEIEKKCKAKRARRRWDVKKVCFAFGNISVISKSISFTNQVWHFGCCWVIMENFISRWEDERSVFLIGEGQRVQPSPRCQPCCIASHSWLSTAESHIPSFHVRVCSVIFEFKMFFTSVSCDLLGLRCLIFAHFPLMSVFLMRVMLTNQLADNGE